MENRCASKYGRKSSKITRVKYIVFRDTYNLPYTAYPYINWPSIWKELFKVIEGCVPEIKVSKVCWQTPSIDMVKLNTDGSSMDNPGNMGVGRICRNHMGELIFPYSYPVRVGTNSQAELEDALFGLT